MKPKAYLVTFEWVAHASQWEKTRWTVQLAPFLAREAQVAYQALDDTLKVLF